MTVITLPYKDYIIRGALILCVGIIIGILLMFCMSVVYTEEMVYNRPVEVIERKVSVFEQHNPMNIIDTDGNWISRGEAVELTPVKEGK
jgi:hypothetical protein